MQAWQTFRRISKEIVATATQRDKVLVPDRDKVPVEDMLIGTYMLVVMLLGVNISSVVWANELASWEKASRHNVVEARTPAARSRLLHAAD